MAERWRYIEALRRAGWLVLNPDPYRWSEDERRHVAATMAKSRPPIESPRAFLPDLIDDNECRLDHNGYCQTHLAGKPCAVPLARAWLASVAASPTPTETTP